MKRDLDVSRAVLRRSLFAVLSGGTNRNHRNAVVTVIHNAESRSITRVLVGVPRTSELGIGRIAVSLSRDVESVIRAIFPGTFVALSYFRVLGHYFSNIRRLQLHCGHRTRARVEHRRQHFGTHLGQGTTRQG